jgi:hypothetical protein
MSAAAEVSDQPALLEIEEIALSVEEVEQCKISEEEIQEQ